MNNKLSILSRILVAFASGALVVVFFLPVWRIDLFAPQYPEGLTMKIWINTISGDVDVINGLNHYIGMKHITVGMFPEFKFLSYVVGFFMILGVIIALTGYRKILFVYLVLTLIGGMLAMYDFYSWGYDYGHNLDPKAPIQVPGLSYQPPLFGHKRLLNFDAYSFPDVGGWVVIIAGLLAFAVWFGEWYHNRKRFRTIKLAKPAAAAMLLLLFSSCETKPVPFVAGKDNCYFCKMGISDLRFGGEVITRKGIVRKFDDLHCMISFLQSGVEDQKNIAKTVVVDFGQPGKFIDAANAAYVISNDLKSPMGSNTAGFADENSAAKYLAGKQGEVINWQTLNSRVK